MKKTYQKPQTDSILVKGSILLVSASEEVNSYSKGADIYAGDTDDEPNP